MGERFNLIFHDMNGIYYIKHTELTKDLLYQICTIKSLSWPYNIKSQKNWINANISDDDFHVLLFDNDILIAYFNFIPIEIIIDGQNMNALGIGNVCTKEKSKGYGKKIMLEANRFLLGNDLKGLLFCKKETVTFYSKFQWDLINKLNLNLFADNTNFETMIFNCTLKFKKLEYFNKIF